MEKELKQKVALAVIGLLIVIKFILLPQLTKQNELIGKINAVEKINNKYSQLISQQPKLEKYANKISMIEKSLSKDIPVYVTQADFLLATQKNLETIMAKYNINVKRFIWFNGDDDPILGQLYKKRIRVVIVGNSIDFLQLHTWFKNNEPKYRLESLSLNVNKKTASDMGIFTGTLIISAYFNKAQ